MKWDQNPGVCGVVGNRLVGEYPSWLCHAKTFNTTEIDLLTQHTVENQLKYIFCHAVAKVRCQTKKRYYLGIFPKRRTNSDRDFC